MVVFNGSTIEKTLFLDKKFLSQTLTVYGGPLSFITFSIENG